MTERCAAGGTCIDAERAIAFAAGELGEVERSAIEARIDTCPRCRGVVAEAGRNARPVAGDTIDRYTVERALGAGGMGVVSLARDPELERRVVIKLVRPELATGEGSDAFEARLRREAQAMALLSHPNVVQIFDIGRHGDRIFLALEYVDGQTLDVWLADRPRSVDEILAVLAQAGAGLAAAHRAGLVHRDVKPSNILVGLDGVVKVTDFGLARGFGGDAESPGARSTGDRGVRAVLTHADAVVGTPAYMSPEQARGDTVDARSDQYAFALTAFDALLGQSPAKRHVEPTGATDAALAAAGVRSRVRAAIARSLERDPAARFATMTELLRALGPAHRRRPRWVDAAAIVMVGGIVAVWLVSRTPVSSSCPLAADVVETELPAATRLRLDTALRELGPGRATFAALVGTRLDAGLAAWSQAYERSCPRPACLEGKLGDLATVIDDALADRDRSLADVAMSIASWTDDLGTCSGGVDGSREYRHQLARAIAYWRQERPERAIAAADAALALATDPITKIRARTRRVNLADPTPDDFTALRGLYDEAGTTGDRELRAVVALTAADACPTTACTEEWTNRLADAVAQVPADSRYRSELAGMRGELAMRAGTPAVAVAMYEDEVRQITALQGERSFDLIPALTGLAEAHAELRQPDAALAAARRADDIAVWWLGVDHPYRANTLGSLGLAKYRMHDLPGAIEAMNRAIALRGEVEGADSPRLGWLYNSLAACYQELGKPAQALPLLDLALAANAKLKVPAVPSRLDFLRNSAIIASTLGRADSRKRIDDAFALATALPPDHPRWTQLHDTRGIIELRARQLGPAREDLVQALAGYERMGEVAEVADIQVMAMLTVVALESGRLVEARRWVARAMELAKPRGPPSRLAVGLAAIELAIATGDHRTAREQLDALAPALADPLVIRFPGPIAHYYLLAETLAKRTGDAATASRARDQLTAVLTAAEIPEEAALQDCAVCTAR